MTSGEQTNDLEVSRRQEMRHDGLTKESTGTINADQSAATLKPANKTDHTQLWLVQGAGIMLWRVCVRYVMHYTKLFL